MLTSQATLNERETTDKPSESSNKIYIKQQPYFESETLHRYYYNHIKSIADNYVYNKIEIRPTPISLPAPLVSPEIYGTSLQKWYQKKPLFTLTAKGQVKRLQKYLEIQKMLEICKKEYENQFHTQNMKIEDGEYDFKSMQPLLYEDKYYCCECPCDSSKNFDIDFMPVDYSTCNSPEPRYCTCHLGKQQQEQEKKLPKKSPEDNIYKKQKSGPIRNETRTSSDIIRDLEEQIIPTKTFLKNEQMEDDSVKTNNAEEKVIPTRIVQNGRKIEDDRGIYKIVVKNKDDRRFLGGKYVMKLFDNLSYDEDDSIRDEINKSKRISKFPGAQSNFIKSYIALDSVATLPFDENECAKHRSCRQIGRRKLISSAAMRNANRYDINRNEMF